MNRRKAAIEALQENLGHRFADQALLERALTHASASGGGTRVADNERLEFLGDRVLGLAMAQCLMLRDGEAGAGALAQRFATLVSREACARVARALKLGEALRLAAGDSAQGARNHETIIADACEAVLAALYLELGFEAAAEKILSLWAPLIEESIDLSRFNPKSSLQELAAVQGRSTPVYKMLARSGPDHRPSFQVEVSLGADFTATAEGGSLQAAQKAAATILLDRLRSVR